MYSSAMLYAAIGFAVNAGGGPSRPQNTASILHSADAETGQQFTSR